MNPASSTYNIDQIRQDFPNLGITVHGKPLVYLDNAATTLKPQQVFNAIDKHYKTGTSNVHRGVHYMSERATQDFEDARVKIQGFLNAQSSSEIIFTKGTTESINLVASSFGRHFINKGDEIIISEMEHHSNIVPWQLLCEERGCVLKVVPIDDSGEIILGEFDKLLSEKTKLISIVHISNSLGTINPIKDIIDKAHQYNVPVLIDAAQSISHTPIDVTELDCDFLAFSGHKFFGPTGTGVLYGKQHWLDQMPPYQGGGDMISSVTFEKTTFNHLPYKFEAGTPNIIGVIGLGAAIDYIQSIGLNNIARYKDDLLDYGTKVLSNLDGLKMIGTAKKKASILSFVVDSIHAHDMGTLVDEEGIAIRTGHHCTQPVMKHFGVPATSRASISLYNTKEEFDKLAVAIKKAKALFE